MLLTDSRANPMWPWVTGVFVLLSGLVVVALHQYWQGAGPIIVSLLGWLTLLKVDGFLRITDRKKDMFKTSQGKYGAPSAIDARFKGLRPYVSELLVYGEAKPYCVALVSVDNEPITDWAGQDGLAGRSFAEIARDEKTQERIAEYIDARNLERNRWEQIKRFTILDRELSVEAGDLTPSLKLRRKVVIEKLSDRLSALYEPGSEKLGTTT